MMREAVEQSNCHLCIAEDGRSFPECKVCGDDDGCALVELADQVEQQLTTGLGEWQVSQIIEHDEVSTYAVVPTH